MCCLKVGFASFQQSAVNFLCEDPEWACLVWQNLANASTVVRLSLVKWAAEGCGWRATVLQEVMLRALQVSLSFTSTNVLPLPCYNKK